MARIRGYLLAAAASGLIADGAGAQTAPDPAPAAATTPARDDAPPEILVTARRVEERLQDVPASITVFSQATLDDKNVRSVTDLATFAPSLTVNQRFGAKGATFSLRGFSQASRTASSVGVYFADVVAPRGGNGSTPAGEGATPGSFFDLENVQVLNGPQGTLFGRNTTGGAVILVPRRPTDRVEGYVEASYGNYDYKRLQAVINLPLSEGLRFRAGVDYLDRDGFLRNISGVGPDRYGDQAYVSVRASLIADLSETLENYTVGTYSYAHDNGAMSKVTACTNTFPFGLLACQQIARGAGQGFYTVEGALPEPKSNALQWQVINTTTLTVSDTLTLKNIASYSQVRTRFVTDILGARYLIPSGAFGPLPSTGSVAGASFGFAEATRAPGRFNADQQNIVEELRAQGSAADGALTYQAGAYYERSTPRRATGTQAPNLIQCSDSDNFQCTDVFGILLRRSIGFLGNQIGRVSFLNRALYAQATYAVADTLKLAGGIRYTWDRTRARGELRGFRFASATGVPLATPTTFCTLGAFADANCRTDTTAKSDAPTWLIGVDYTPADDVLLYAKYTRGYRQGAVSYNAPPPYQSVGPEKVDAYEIGAKTSFSGAISGTFNVAAFYNELQNQQINVALSSSINATTSTSTNLNAGRSEIAGIEVQASLRPFDGLTLEGNLEYLHTQVKSLDVQNLPAGIYDVVQPSATVGGRLPFVPKFKWNVTATYQLPLPAAAGRANVAATYARSSSFIYTTGPFGVIEGVGLLNASLNWNAIGGSPVDVSLFATNLTGRHYYTAVADLRGSGGFVSSYFGEPRSYGIRVRYTLGE